MKDKGVMPGKIISRNWVLKRKRKKLPYGPDMLAVKVNDSAAECAKNPSSGKGRQKTEIKLEPCSSKRTGNDGYYYECVICDLGGNLLCCDTCPRTYHLECLDPPLKTIPIGKWKCPQCFEKHDSSEPSYHQGKLTKRARTKVVTEKSKAESNSSVAVKVPPFLGSSGLGKKRSSTKKKSMRSCGPMSEKKLASSPTDVSCSGKSQHLSHYGSLDGSSSYENGADLKKCDLTPYKNERTSDSSTVDKPSERMSNSQVGEELLLSKAMDSVPNEGTSERRPGSSNRKKFGGSDLAVAQAHKRKLKVNEDKSKKKSKTTSGIISVNMLDKHKSKARASCKNTKAPRKGGSGDCGRGASTSKEHVGSKGVNTRQKHEKLPLAAMGPPKASGDGVTAYEVVPCEDTSLEEPSQVDRVLGCRVQDQMQLSQQNSVMVAVAQSSGNQHDLENKTRLCEVNPECDTVDSEDTENHSRDQNVENHLDEAQCIENDAVEDRIRVYQRSFSKECNQLKTGDVMGSTGGQGTAAGEVEEKSSSLTEDLPVPCPLGEKVEANKSSGDCGIAVKKIQNTISSETSLLNDGKILYEFLVKWVGKSHIHNSWISESMLKSLAKRKLDNYKAKYGTASMNICEERWIQPQRVIALRPSKDGTAEAFIKWSGLPYDECTWERIDEPVIKKSLHLIEIYNQLERNTVEKDGDQEKLPKNSDCQQTEIPTLTEQPKELKGGSLFPHQLEALNWLRKCWYRSKNVILADEMGLGKTVSACAFISSLYREFKAKLPCLVLVPLSTMPNWMAEFALWAPDLNVVEYHGSARARNLIRQYEWHANYHDGSHKKTKSYKFNALLTTYEMVLADSSHLRGIPWEVLVVDEGHRLKNSGSKLFSLLNTFSFQHRVLLTGTPLQNNIGEMYNLLNFLQPASFPSLSSFEENFKDLTTAEKVEELKKLVAPHMLRRLKKDAMQNIPPKIERMVPVELSSIQAEYYRAMLTKNYQLLRNMGKGVAQQSMLNIVMQLRKVCNHPYLIPGTEPDSGSVEFLQEMRIKASAKLTLLHSMLKILHKEGHRVLIFSQMTKLLDILEDYLTIEFGPKSFERVDGSVSVADRQAAIARYNQDKSRFVFLLSTRSCGLGINLATADTVIIYDSDFNPHADIQAMNRAHRIGQSNRLLVYRLVVRASVEERILQLAKKKLMLDQLFVNKFGSQKEVEDILRWGTEELFGNSYSKDSGENDVSKAEATADTEQKSKRRTGGLGDVYEDKCREGSSKIIWDENAISKLLDRSNLQSGSSDTLDGDLDNDMLGSVKSVEWNDEPVEEEGRTESPLVVTEYASVANSDKKEDNLVSGTEENEWDKLLRVRWEKYQIEEEAALGRGKRLRKAVSYREVFAPHANETFSESGGDEDPEPEPEPQREYTPAGRALKEKFARLRARQKERLARQKELDKRKALEGSIPAKGLLGHESVSHFPLSNLRERGETSMLVPPFGEKTTLTDREDNQVVELEAPQSRIDTMQKFGRLSKHKLRSHQNSLAKPVSHSSLENAHPSQSFQGSGSTNSGPVSNFLPVLGLCAPNASQAESFHRNSSRSHGRESKHEGTSDFPSHLSPFLGTSTERDTLGLETAGAKLTLPVTSSEVPQQHVRNIIAEKSHPFPLCPPFLQGQGAESSGATSTDFLAKMRLPILPFDEKLLPRFAKNFQSPPPDFFPSLSLGRRDDTADGSMLMPPMVPLLPKFKFPLQDSANYNQLEMQMPPTLSLGETPNAPFPDSHRKVLESIMLRAGTGSSSSLKRKSKVEDWSDDELDSLWIGVRRHGRGNWDAMLRDARLKFSKHKTQNDLAARWEEEQLKILDAVPRTKSHRSNKPILFPSIPDGMMTHALHGSRLGGPLKFQSHLADIKLGFGDPDLSHFKPSGQGNNEIYAPIATCRADNFPPSFPGDNSNVPSDRPETSSNAYMEPPSMQNASGSTNLHPLDVICSGSFDPRQKNDDLGLSRYRKLPCLMDRSLNPSLDSLEYAWAGEPASASLLPDFNDGLNISCSKGKEVAVEKGSHKDNLPHWLRDAVNAPVRHPDPELPPTVSAIAESVRLLYAEQKPTIPPFVVPTRPPSRPKDPRKKLKKKKRQQMLGNFPTDAGTSQESPGGFPGDNLACGSISTIPPFPMLPQPISGLSSIEPNLQFPDVNMMNPLSSVLGTRRKVSTDLSPSPEVLQLVASYSAPGPHPSPSPGMTSLTSIDDKPSSLPEASDEEQRGVVAKDSHHEAQCLLPQEGIEQSEDGNSSRNQTNACPADLPETEEISSEKTVSDDHAGDHEPHNNDTGMKQNS